MKATQWGEIRKDVERTFNVDTNRLLVIHGPAPAYLYPDTRAAYISGWAIVIYVPHLEMLWWQGISCEVAAWDHFQA